MDKRFYITTTLPYVNAEPHIGFALEIVVADIIARYKKLQGFDVFFNTGTDEHGLKIYQKALEEGKDPQDYVDEYADKFRQLGQTLGLSPDMHFIRTTDTHHKGVAQEFWKRCEKNGYIYKKNYKTRYCVGCELEKTDSELVDEKCPIHPNLEIQHIDEENYFFKFSAFQKKLLELYEDPTFVIPNFRFNEIKMFVKSGLEDFSISRLKSKMPWGVPVPGDDHHVMYVWFDALVNYISTIGWPEDPEQFSRYWPVVQFAGKDQVRQQAAMWQAMLMAAGLPPSKHIVIHGFINVEGKKMSKSLGNVIAPNELVGEYGVDAVRYFLAREISFFEDSDISRTRLKEAYNANLANGIGNLVSRVLKMAITNSVRLPSETEKGALSLPYKEALDAYKINEACEVIWRKIQEADRYIQDKQPFKLIKTDPESAKKDIALLLVDVWKIAVMLEPIMPSTAATIQTLVKKGEMPATPLFPRKD